MLFRSIIDSNSSISHTTSFPILKESRFNYFILNLDFNNVRNNLRYQDNLKEMGVFDKVRYVLNEDLSEEVGVERAEFTSGELEDLGFKLEASIPIVNKTIFNNRIYQGIPLVLGDEKETSHARSEILKIANKIYPIMNYSESNGEELIKKKRRGFRR